MGQQRCGHLLLAAESLYNVRWLCSETEKPRSFMSKGILTAFGEKDMQRHRWKSRSPRPARTRLQLEHLESRTLLAADMGPFDSPREAGPPEKDRASKLVEVRSLDGTGNNLSNPEWGSTGQNLLRITSMEYADGIAAPAGQDRQSPRVISNAVAAQSESLENGRGLTDLAWMWGQFIDHDIDLTGHVSPAEPFDIEVPNGDAYFDPNWMGGATIALSRSLYDHDTGESSPRLQLNQITAFIDGSMIYASDGECADELRLFEGGKLKTSAGEMLPFNEAGLDNAGGTDASLFLAGDVRANENVALSALHTLWVREHNRIAEQISDRNPSFSDEHVFQQAKSLVVAELQAITYNEFLPALLGENAIREYAGYDPAVNPGISNIFSTAAYRFGHSMLSPELLRLDDDGNVTASGNLPLRNAFFAPHELTANGIDSLLRGAAQHRAQEVDTMVVEDVRSFLFGPPGSGGFDLASLNIQRGRDHGLPDYNQARLDLGLTPVEDFDDITSDVALQDKLETAYGDVTDIDVWVGGLAEDRLAGANVGELVFTVLADQFERLRDGDRFWYQNVFRGALLRELENTTLAAVIQRNTDVADLQENVFFVAEQQPDNQVSDAVGPRYRGPISPRLHPGPMRPTQKHEADPGPPPQTQGAKVRLPRPAEASSRQTARATVVDSQTDSDGEDSEGPGGGVCRDQENTDRFIGRP